MGVVAMATRKYVPSWRNVAREPLEFPLQTVFPPWDNALSCRGTLCLS